MKRFRSIYFTSIYSAALFLAMIPAQAAGPAGTVYQFTVPKQGSMVADPTYYCWLPADMGTARTIIVHQHGCTREGDAHLMMSDVQWLSLAKKWHAPFIAPALTTGSNCGNWNQISNGSGDAFLMALDTLARRSGHPEITTVPWALWGHSGGSMWITAMTGKYPARVAVGVAQACATEVSNIPEALKVPILHHNGKFDLCYNDTYFANGRAKGALWAHAINPLVNWIYNPNNDPNTMMGHAPHDLRMIAIPWIEAGLTSRLPAQAGGSQLAPMDTSQAWLGDKTTLTIAPAASFTGNKLAACWFPNQAFAMMWKEYMTNGTIRDTLTPPPAPTNLTGTFANRQFTLKWDADADLESGIKTFIIYRNGTVLTTLQYPNMPQTHFTLEKGFQRWNDGDQTVPSPAPAMTYTDNAVTGTGTYNYQISTVNWSDLSSPKSRALTLNQGTVGIQEDVSSHQAVLRAAYSLCWNEEACTLDLSPGITDLFDLRGNLLKTVDMEAWGKVDARTLLGNKAGSVIMMRRRIHD